MSGKASPKLAAVAAQEEQHRLSKSEFLDPRIREEEVEIASMGGKVTIRSLSYLARKELRSRCGWGSEETWDDEKFTVLCIIHSVIDPDLTEDDIPMLEAMDQGVFDELVMRVTLLNMMGRTEPLKKDSETIGSSDSVST